VLFPRSTSARIDSTELDSIKLRINQIQDWITFHKNWEWRQRKFYLTTIPPYETGTIAVTQGSRTITGTGTTFTAEHRTGYFVLNNKAYKIKNFTSTTVLILEAPYPDDTESGSTYQIVFPHEILNHEISSIAAVRINNGDLDVKRKDRLIHDIENVGEPQEAAVGNYKWEDFYNSSTVAVTNDSKTITLASGTWPDEIEGKAFRVNDHSRLYTIDTKDSSTTATLEEVYQGTTASGKSYAIGPKGSQLITFRSSPDKRYFVEIEALVRATKLVGATEQSIIPDHAPLLHGAIWLALLDFQSENPVRIQQARADFERSLKEFEMTYATNSNLQWKSPLEDAARRGNLTNFDPLRDNFLGLR